jgi:PIN domain nuclease of toxin-antitoxin system
VTRYLLDTHVLIWTVLQASREVSKGFFAEMESWQQNGLVFLSPFTAWELALLVEARQLDLGMTVERVWQSATQDDGFSIATLNAHTLIEANRLPGFPHRDPADRILVATARENGMTFVTRDKKLLDYARAGHINARKP